jgi:cell division protein FtsQ
MENKKRYSIKKILFAVMWVVIASSTGVLLVAAIRKNDLRQCKKVEIKISGIENSLLGNDKFVDEDEVLGLIKNICKENIVGKTIGSFNLKMIEAELEKSKWVKNAELFFDNNDMLRVSLYEKEPVARVFTTTGSSFYIDTALAMLPLSDKFSARLPVFTGFPSDNIVLSSNDSNLLRGIKTISMAIQNDSFCMAMIEQIDITQQRSFEMIPKIGNQIIVFGNATEVPEKINKLHLFYKNVMVKTGWSKYSVINVQYKNQVVAKIRGAEDKTADSVRTLQMMQAIATNAAKQSEDSIQSFLQDNINNTADSSMIQQSIQREDNFETTNAINESPLQSQNNQQVTNPLPLAKQIVVKPVATKPAPAKKVESTKPVVLKTKPAAKPVTILPNKPILKPVAKPAQLKSNPQKPKAVLQNKNDYTPTP